MGRYRFFRKLQQLSVVMLGAYVVTGCPSPTASKLLANSATQQTAVAQEAINETINREAGNKEAVKQELTAQTTSDFQVSSVSYEVCSDVENWQRPSAVAQSKRLGDMARYGDALQTDALKAASTQFWDHSVVSFTTYGLSARLEPENLSGVWTAAEEMASCYTAEDTAAINEGDRAEAWLLNQRISSLDWTGDRYVMTVEPAPSGLQVIQFERTDELANLPLEVITSEGEAISVMSGDWQ